MEAADTLNTRSELYNYLGIMNNDFVGCLYSDLVHETLRDIAGVTLLPSYPPQSIFPSVAASFSYEAGYVDIVVRIPRREIIKNFFPVIQAPIFNLLSKQKERLFIESFEETFKGGFYRIG